jgi:hypothetical protein
MLSLIAELGYARYAILAAIAYGGSFIVQLRMIMIGSIVLVPPVVLARGIA